MSDSLNNDKIILGATYYKYPSSLGDRIKLYIAHIYYVAANSSLFLLQKLLYKKSTNKIPKILVFRTGSLGDSVCAIPSIKAIRKCYPDSKIDILTNTGKSNLVGLSSLLSQDDYNQLLDYYSFSKVKLFNILRKQGYDLVIQLPQVDARYFNLLRDLFLFRFVAGSGFGWYVSQVFLFRGVQAKYLAFPTETLRLGRLMARNGIRVSELSSYILPSINDSKRTSDFLKDNGFRADDKLVAIVVGSKRPQNRWPVSYFSEVINFLLAEYKIVLVGSEADNLLIQELTNIPGIINACGKLKPMETAELLKICVLTISNDTGPLHISYAVGTPTIGIFSGRDLRGKWSPPDNGTNFALRVEGLYCHSCVKNECDNRCLKLITPFQVINCAKNLLNRD